VAVSPTGPDAGDIFVTNENVGGNSGTVSVINPADNNMVTATITVGTQPTAAAVSPTGPDAGDIFVTNLDSNSVSVINPNTNTVIGTIPVGTNPSEVAVSPTGEVFVANLGGDTVSVIT
jgi:YVTN family beta-propeller protein